MSTSNIFNYKTNNFLATPEGTDTNLRIYNKIGKLKYTVTPIKCYFYYKDRLVYIRQDGSNNITLDFENETEAALALTMLNAAKGTFFKSDAEARDYYTKIELNNGQLDNRYYTETEADDNFVDITGDQMTGDLSILTLSGDTIINTNIDELGKLIKGNQSLIRKTISGNDFVDSFEKTLDFSVFWEYAVKNNTNIRAGVIVAAWDETSNNVVFTHHSTMDLGNTDDIDFNVGMDGGNNYLRLLATCTQTWEIKVLRRFNCSKILIYSKTLKTT